ncbi:MAG: FAD-dependent oxidoreductase [Alphaproteobacteria bacterium]|nr:FAD-dependent oxidoreductase [Alphaproteobacteria bacterium]
MKVAIVGAGPAGIAAADVLAAHGVAPVVIDEGRHAGGQIYRQPRDGLPLDIAALLGAEAENYQRTHATFDRLKDRIDYRPQTLAWGVEERTLHTVHGSAAATFDFDALILATGATDRTLPIAGWTLPGVFTLGGAQVLLKEHGCLIGRRVVFCGASPLLYLAAKQYRAMGAEIAAVLDTTPFSAKMAAALDLMAAPRTFARGLGTMAALRRAGVAIHHGVQLHGFEGTDGVEAARFRTRNGEEVTLACDAVAFGFGLKPETQLAEHAGAELRYDATFRQWLPHADIDGRCGGAIYVAGDGATIGGAQAATLTGKLAACAVLEDFKITAREIDRAQARSAVARLRRFQRGLARAFAWPAGMMAGLDDNVMVCRCEGISAGDLRTALRADFGPREVNRLKAITRCGMGRCQGRFCGLPAAELTAQALKAPLESVGRLRMQPPVKPIPLAIKP